MNVHFIDTSVLVNILDIPNRNSHREVVLKEYEGLKNSQTDTLLLPLATIIETGNHIAHIRDGNIRRSKGKAMAQMLKDMANGVAPWDYYEGEITRDDLLYFSKNFPDMAMKGTGIGDLSIVSAYNKYKESVPAIGFIRIWSLDGHLAAYEEKMTTKRRRKR
ncbi:MAG: hypothetical protein N4A57_08855 [Anaeromicrobium sp.]|jgi:hypothetical protein|uniref:hypothetical protein n=1 Tax=Anaeromicrobium sp. TaxID=1929132 RepID=UPI0025E82B5B|nr:hypothetical protein [Anaeromicrobium sp.]MCT4594360.1 hypothetical protein [Anaeromicrobium sp.]